VRKPRRNETRYEIIKALAVLTTAEDWPKLTDGERCHRVEQHLTKPSEWCKARTLNRAIKDYQKTKPTA
jgi:hypothetical protein